MQIELRQGRPAYIQIRDSIRDQILSGALPPGAQLPSDRALAAQLGVNRSTVIVAFDELVAEGLIASRGVRGRFVIWSPEAAAG